ncbi:bifunctional UDP-N-acetylglucosamine diphosphorylase/glucosamine-1-phosphate N-acetyltransferase GlmU [Helicobacter sp.]|uniref:bifunctional UDP-N-acetylglucosamine diphosphorylase/glucosamine-1-phosphate N-acetyltransferase GlmU n=1 Tax=Helicobacter sp. TaxID=218 RepID=UPI0025BD1A0C|nr:bifunctional UDP-N-acetylglucosamine diphosphorylase/glucosamine-1-phosphate N-acetyltransferase GlmU [Helicobacter sp.]MCI5968676.1 bifunctional UDP-N-acetylglucosamine diphosphorylase/glucosamine-1-phosphate N-acetyltransferase GlmU [Helicobacter sp.]MDY2584498.1 bifunctional UDP-N-acetylglucosamine diphosphorylase/glucosamine-1-phosphate N-acetyltransferase GlmU [Helicobacter sp.]
MQNNTLSIVILAAGKGTRMQSSIPKVLHRICGREMLYYSIKESLLLSDDVCVVLGFENEKIQAKMQEYFGNKIRFAIQDTQNFPGTGGALKTYCPKYEKVLVLNGDMPLIQANELKQFLYKDADIIMSVLDLPNVSGYGRVVMSKDEVQAIIEEKDADSKTLALSTLNAGVYCFKTHILDSYIPKLTNNNAQKEYYLTDIISLARQDNIKIIPLFVKLENFKGVNDKLDLANAEEILSKRIKEFWLKQGVIMRLPKTIYIEEGVEFSGECVVENGVSICGDSKITNSYIKAHSVIESSIVANSDVGPLAHLRPQSVLKNSHIGNFVEVKKSTLNGVKVGHLSYIGDSEIESGTNIGAGFITCNYDGKNKHQTKIGKNVFIGSDSQAVAPITIEDDCLIGAGSTIRRNLKKGELFITCGKEILKEGFFYKFFNKKT